MKRKTSLLAKASSMLLRNPPTYVMLGTFRFSMNDLWGPSPTMRK